MSAYDVGTGDNTGGVTGGTANPKTGWLVMLYLAGDNNLTEEMLLTLEDIVAEGVPAGDKFVAQLDPSGAGLFTQRYDFSDPAGKRRLDDFRVQRLGPEINTGNPEALVNFATWALEEYSDPSLNLLLILSGHGSGTTDDFLLRDENPDDSLSIPELGEALEAIRVRAGRKIDIVGMDACYMSMGEVAYQIRDSADIVIGSEGLEPGFGWPYRRMLANAKAHRKTTNAPMSPRELASALVETYVNHYSSFDLTAGRSVDMAAIDAPKLETVATALAELVDELRTIDEAGHKKQLLAHWYAQTFKFDQFVDLADLCAQMIPFHVGNGMLTRKCQDVIAAVDMCVLKAGCSGFAYQYSHGLSIYYPWALVNADYRCLEFTKTTKWHEFLDQHVRMTRRAPRSGFLPPPVPPVADDLEAYAPPDLLTTSLQASVDKIAAVASLPTQVAGTIKKTRRLLLADRLGLAKSRFTERTKFTTHTKFTERTKGPDPMRTPGDLEKSVKNVPAVVGVAFEPPGGWTSGRPAST